MTIGAALAYLGLAVVGIDPFGGIVAAAALARGAGRRALAALMGTYTLCVVVEVALLRPLLAWAGRLLAPLLSAPLTWSLAQLVIALALLAVALHQGLSLRRDPSARPRRAPGVSVRAMAIAAALLALTSLADPPFLAAIALSGHMQPAWLGLVLLICWNLIYQGPMFVLGIAGLTPLRERAVAAYLGLVERWHRPLVIALVIALVLAGIALGIEAVAAMRANAHPWLHLLAE